MLHADALASLASALEADPSPESGPDDRLAAVLAPIVLEPEPSLVFTVRAAALSRHAGEISFPGGLQDPGETLVETALREAHEEIGLDPSLPTLLGALPPVHTFVSRDRGRALRRVARPSPRVRAERAARSTRC